MDPLKGSYEAAIKALVQTFRIDCIMPYKSL